METIYAKTLNPEHFDYRLYDIREDEGNEVIVDGGKDYKDIDQKDYLGRIKKLINAYDSWDYEYAYKESIMEFLCDYLPKKENGKRLSPKEASRIKKALETFDNRLIACVCLSIITSKKFECKRLCGCSQGEVVYAYYPENTHKEYLDFVEAWFWGTGTEIEIHDEENIPEDADEIEGYTIYIGTWWSDAEELKKIIRKSIGVKPDTPVKLWLYADTKATYEDLYEEAKQEVIIVPKFKFCITTTFRKHVEIEADSYEEAENEVIEDYLDDATDTLDFETEIEEEN